MKLSNRNSGFTMLELLAVLAIVLILGAILFPAIESAREKSLTTACSQNVKQLVLAITQYEQDKGHFPPGRQFLNASAAVGVATDMIKWGNAIAPYMHADPNAVTSMKNVSSIAAAPSLAALPAGDAPDLYPDAYRCPSASNFDKMGYNMSYGYNYQYLGNADPRTIVTATAANRGYVNFPVAKSAVSRPDRTIAVADSYGTGGSGYVTAASTANATPNESRLGAFGYLLDPTFLPVRNLGGGAVGAALVPAAPGVATSTIGPAAGGLIVSSGGAIVLNSGVSVAPAAPGGPIDQGMRGIVGGRHAGGTANYGYLDGHVEVDSVLSAYMQAATIPVVTGATANAGNLIFLSNARWNTFGIDNDADGNGLVEAVAGEKVVDPNEAFVAVGVAPLVGVLYNPTVAGAGYGRITGLGGAYANFGPGFDPSVVAFYGAASGPTLPHVPPFTLPENLTAQQ